jgi:hypothetical protein
MISEYLHMTLIMSDRSSNANGSCDRYDPITLPYEVYSNKSVASKTIVKLETERIL